MIPRQHLLQLAFAAILAASSALALAQATIPTVTLVGEIKVDRGSFPPHRIQVTLESRGLPIGVTYADEEGKFMFRDLLPNMYYVVIKDPDFQPVRERIEILELSGGTAMMQIMLSPMESTKPVTSKDSTSGENPFLVNKSEYEKHYPKNAVKEFDKGNKAAQSSKVADAVDHFKKAISIAPDFYAAHNNLGLIYLMTQRFPDAEQEFQEVVRVNPSDSQAYFNLGNAYLLTKRFPDAEDSIEKGLQRQPDSAFGLFLLGSVYNRTGDSAQAEKTLQHALSVNPQMAKAHLELVNLYLHQNKKNDAIMELKAFLRASPQDPLAPTARVVLDRLERQEPQSK